MEDLLTLLAVGSLISVVTFVARLLVTEKLLKYIHKEVAVADKFGKTTKFFVRFNTPDEDIYKLLDREIDFEGKVKKSLAKYINSHKELNLKLSEENTFDFLLSVNNKKIGLETKSSINSFKPEWIWDYFTKNSDISELIMILDEKVPESLIQEIRRNELGGKVKLVSSPRGKNLSQSLENILNSEIPKLELDKAVQRTSR
jgi:hypothetical protein